MGHRTSVLWHWSCDKSYVACDIGHDHVTLDMTMRHSHVTLDMGQLALALPYGQCITL